MTKLSTIVRTIERDDGHNEDLTLALDHLRRIDTAYEIHLGLYHTFTGPEEPQKLYKEFLPGFFNLIVNEECYRGSAAEDSAWREILAYFDGATQIGLTATLKETKYVSNNQDRAAHCQPIPDDRICRVRHYSSHASQEYPRYRFRRPTWRSNGLALDRQAQACWYCFRS